MRYLLDTNTCIGVLTNRAPRVVERWKQTPPSNVRLCSVVKGELLFGAEKSERRDLVLQRLHLFFSRFRADSVRISYKTSFKSRARSHRRRVEVGVFGAEAHSRALSTENVEIGPYPKRASPALNRILSTTRPHKHTAPFVPHSKKRAG